MSRRSDIYKSMLDSQPGPGPGSGPGPGTAVPGLDFIEAGNMMIRRDAIDAVIFGTAHKDYIQFHPVNNIRDWFKAATRSRRMEEGALEVAVNIRETATDEPGLRTLHGHEAVLFVCRMFGLRRSWGLEPKAPAVDEFDYQSGQSGQGGQGGQKG